MTSPLHLVLDLLFARLRSAGTRAELAAVVDDFSRVEHLELLLVPAVSDAAQARHDHNRALIADIYRAALKKLLARAQMETLRGLRGRATPPKAVEAAVEAAAVGVGLKPGDTLDWLFNLEEFRDDFMAALRAAGAEAYVESSRGALADLLGQGELQDWQVTRAGLVQKFVNARDNALKDAPDEIYRAIQDELKEGALAGETMPELAARVREAFAGVGERRADLIARTETASAYSTAALDSMRAAGFARKRWVISTDERVRTSHRECAAQGPIPVDEPFKNGLMNPGDPQGEAREVINCRCYLEAVK